MPPLAVPVPPRGPVLPPPHARLPRRVPRRPRPTPSRPLPAIANPRFPFQLPGRASVLPRLRIGRLHPRLSRTCDDVVRRAPKSSAPARRPHLASATPSAPGILSSFPVSLAALPPEGRSFPSSRQGLSQTPHVPDPSLRILRAHIARPGARGSSSQAGSPRVLEPADDGVAYLGVTTVAKSSSLHEYPHSLSYHATSFTKVGSSCMPALASNTDVQLSPRKSVETTSSSV